jgi:hypothetical protein
LGSVALKPSTTDKTHRDLQLCDNRMSLEKDILLIAIARRGVNPDGRGKTQYENGKVANRCY